MVVKIDKKGLNVSHFTAMPREEAIERMIADGITKDRDWADRAYDKMLEAQVSYQERLQSKLVKKNTR